MHPRVVLGISALTAAAGVAACGSSSSNNNLTGLTTSPMGSLTVNVSTPNGVVGDIVVTGPGSYSRTVTATTTIVGLAPGSYALTSYPSAVSDQFVSTLDTGAVSTSPVTVTANDTVSTSVTYAQRPGTGLMWVVNQGAGDVADGYTSAAITATGSPSPASALTGQTRSDTTTAAVDTHGNLWVAFSTGDSVAEYTPAQLGAGGTLTPAATVHLADHPHGIAFDSAGNLWVSLNTTGQVAKFAASAVVAFTGSVTPAPSVTLTVPGTSPAPLGLAFDASGDLWVCDAGSNQVYEFASGNLTTSASPADSLIGAGASYGVAPVSLAFDANGDLWIATGSALVEYSAGQLSAGKEPSTPFDIVQVTNAAPYGIAFDNSGDLWIAEDSAYVIRLNSSQLHGFGSVTQSAAVRVNLSNHGAPAIGLLFDPHPSGTPLAGARVPRANVVRARTAPHTF
jgi:hypothetical protein